MNSLHYQALGLYIRLKRYIFHFAVGYLPLASGQIVAHLPLIEGLGGSAAQRGERDHPGVSEGLGT